MKFIQYLKDKGFVEYRIRAGEYQYTKGDEAYKIIGLGLGMVYTIKENDGVKIWLPLGTIPEIESKLINL